MSEVKSVYLIVNSITGITQHVTIREEQARWWINADIAGEGDPKVTTGYDVYEFPAVIRHLSTKRPIA